ncbi:MAG: type II toxin-antitoxin system VapB family antitoxin [Leptospiraceae bacterium]|nr:type II toxin-antitoxin system VapB family antitoxin [Leptospiraceae bacterium]
MKTTLYIPEDLLSQAMEYSGIKEKTGVLQEGLRALIREKAAERIIKLGGSDKKAKRIPRRIIK